MQIEIIDLLGLLGFIISLVLLLLTFFEYRITSEKHQPALQVSWDRLPPKKHEMQNALIVVENIGNKKAHVKEIKIEFSYVDQPQSVAKPGIIMPGLTVRYLFDYPSPPLGRHSIDGYIITEVGFLRKKKITYHIGYVFEKK